jgi:hypothetical protein
LDLALHLSSESVTYHCKHLLGENYLRINEELGEEMPFDEIKFVEELVMLGEKVYQDRREEIKKFILS